MPNNSLISKTIFFIFTKKLYLQNLPWRLPPPEKKHINFKILVSVNKWYIHKYAEKIAFEATDHLLLGKS